MIMLYISKIFLAGLILIVQPTTVSANQTSKITELRLYSNNGQELNSAEGMMPEIVVTAEYPQPVEATNRTNKFQQFNDYFTFVVNMLIVLFFMGMGITTLLSKWRQRKNQKKEKGPFSLPPFSNKNIDLGEDYAC